ncbi:hypothetical protein MTR_2g091365 [Medicago truncatula]|uniref:Uncharacterized protein n=1 Tax=Medicago truncatula TaxID=3880 RepID=A0A072VMD5_MEDTR|nr:hypothetical protein MTR_2g091365 [Medicago truncatula]
MEEEMENGYLEIGWDTKKMKRLVLSLEWGPQNCAEAVRPFLITHKAVPTFGLAVPHE